MLQKTKIHSLEKKSTHVGGIVPCRVASASLGIASWRGIFYGRI